MQHGCRQGGGAKDDQKRGAFKGQIGTEIAACAALAGEQGPAETDRKLHSEQPARPVDGILVLDEMTAFDLLEGEDMNGMQDQRGQRPDERILAHVEGEAEGADAAGQDRHGSRAFQACVDEERERLALELGGARVAVLQLGARLPERAVQASITARLGQVHDVFVRRCADALGHGLIQLQTQKL